MCQEPSQTCRLSLSICVSFTRSRFNGTRKISDLGSYTQKSKLSMLPRVLTLKLAILDPTCSFTRSSSRRPCLRELLEKRAGEWIKKIKKITHPPSLLLNLHRHSLSVQLCLRQRATGSGRCERPNCQNSPGNVNTVITPCAELIDCHGGMC